MILYTSLNLLAFSLKVTIVSVTLIIKCHDLEVELIANEYISSYGDLSYSVFKIGFSGQVRRKRE